jgi:hypothetical protein
VSTERERESDGAVATNDADPCADCGSEGTPCACQRDHAQLCTDAFGGGCGLPWRECVCVVDGPCPLDVAGFYT